MPQSKVCCQFSIELGMCVSENGIRTNGQVKAGQDKIYTKDAALQRLHWREARRFSNQSSGSPSIRSLLFSQWNNTHLETLRRRKARLHEKSSYDDC